jgi:hypothetical protein
MSPEVKLLYLISNSLRLFELARCVAILLKLSLLILLLEMLSLSSLGQLEIKAQK